MFKLLFILLFSSHAFSSTLRTVAADSLTSSDLTKTYALPAASDTIVGRSSTDILTNKSIDATTNIISNLTNSNLTSSAAISLSKLAPLTNGSRALSSSAGGLIQESATTSTELGYLSGVTSSIQTQINAKFSGTFTQEIPTGACNGTNTTVTLSFTPSSANAVSLYLDGFMLTQGTGLEYTISGATITLASACGTGQILYANYTH